MSSSRLRYAGCYRF